MDFWHKYSSEFDQFGIRKEVDILRSGSVNGLGICDVSCSRIHIHSFFPKDWNSFNYYISDVSKVGSDGYYVSLRLSRRSKKYFCINDFELKCGKAKRVAPEKIHYKDGAFEYKVIYESDTLFVEVSREKADTSAEKIGTVEFDEIITAVLDKNFEKLGTCAFSSLKKYTDSFRKR